ncbi:MAG: RNA repair transcriptional activator RtcR [Kiritimatiellae bacterium]|nr:RNA repair transcriptional activator RtcR [Kiritimatiellia bacterium]MBQ6327748.1 RNA repair transcriptional activator RtcR [Kiritimatiellia bacterium]
MKTKTVVISVLGTQKDAHGGAGPSRWDTWRPNIGLVQQEELPIDELHLIFNSEYTNLAERIKADIASVSPETKVVFDIIQLKDPWDFEEVYGKFYDYAKSPCFHKESAQYYIHISTGSHVEQICLFLLVESHHLSAKIVQTSPKEGHVRHSKDSKGTCNIIDLDLSKYDKLAKRFEIERQNDLSFLKQGIDTKNAAFNKLIETIERVAVRSSAPILLTGPTGAGKSQLAEQIYLLKKQSKKVKGAFVAVNCATLGGDLAKSALFGHKKGAYSGAGADHDGFLKEADGGIVFLDEIGELPLEAQAMLLKAIEEKCFRPLGAAKDEHSDFQLICGTNRDLAVDVADKRFRADLLSRINLWSFSLPGLAERREDIEPNLAYELARFSEKSGKHISFSKEARKRFMDFALSPSNSWPGNFRDLNAMIVRMATLSDGGRITEEVVADEIARSSHGANPRAAASGGAVDGKDLAALLGGDYAARFDEFDLVQFAHVAAVCRASDTAADAAKKLFAVSRMAKKSSNDSDRLTKYLSRFGVKFKDFRRAPAG